MAVEIKKLSEEDVEVCDSHKNYIKLLVKNDHSVDLIAEVAKLFDLFEFPARSIDKLNFIDPEGGVEDCYFIYVKKHEVLNQILPEGDCGSGFKNLPMDLIIGEYDGYYQIFLNTKYAVWPEGRGVIFAYDDAISTDIIEGIIKEGEDYYNPCPFEIKKIGVTEWQIDLPSSTPAEKIKKIEAYVSDFNKNHNTYTQEELILIEEEECNPSIKKQPLPEYKEVLFQKLLKRFNTIE